jgi:hypothetical protein
LGFLSGGLVAPWRVPERDDGGLLWASCQGVLLPPDESRNGTMEACFGLPVRRSCCPLASPGTGRWRPALGVRSGGLVAPWRVPERDDGGLLWASGQGVLLPPDESRNGTMEDAALATTRQSPSKRPPSLRAWLALLQLIAIPPPLPPAPGLVPSPFPTTELSALSLNFLITHRYDFHHSKLTHYPIVLGSWPFPCPESLLC